MSIIDELRQLSTYLNDLESELSIFFTLSLDMLTITDSNGAFIKVNPAWTTIMGYSPDEVVGRSCFNFIHNDDIALVKEVLVKLEDASIPKILIRMRNKYGQYRLISWAASKVFKGKIYSIGRDVTDVYAYQTKLEEEIKRLKEKCE